jgi:hypothetical protein
MILRDYNKTLIKINFFNPIRNPESFDAGFLLGGAWRNYPSALALRDVD